MREINLGLDCKKSRKITARPCRQKMDKGKIALTPNVEQSGMLGSAFGQNAGSIPALAMLLGRS